MSFSSSLNSSTISISSTSSTTKPFVNIYAKDGRGHDFTSTYKYSTSSKSTPATPAFTRLVYAKDARGVALSTSSSVTDSDYEQLLANQATPIVGDDGLFRSPYDLGQRERTLGYWNELRAASTANLKSRGSSIKSFGSRRSSKQ